MTRKAESRALAANIDLGRLLPEGMSIWAGHKRFRVSKSSNKSARMVELQRGDVVLRNARLLAKSKKGRD